MEGQNSLPKPINQSRYSAFALCQEFRQRLVQLHRLTEKLVETKTEEDTQK
jgi:hypothetical protein